MIYSSTYHHFANVQANLALFGVFSTSCVYLPWEKCLVSSLREKAQATMMTTPTSMTVAQQEDRHPYSLAAFITASPLPFQLPNS